MAELRDYQIAALSEMRHAVGQGVRRIVLQSPTGSGKTHIASEIATLARGKDKRVLFTVPAISLVDQTLEKFYAEGLRDVGVIQARHEMTDWSKPIQIASVQTLQKRGFPRADVVMVDECHRWFRMYEKWFMDPDWKDVPIIGLSATPWTKGLGKYYQKLIIAGTTADMIDKGHLCPFRVYAPTHPDLTGVKTVAGDYAEGELSERMTDDGITADVIATWQKRAEGRPTLCFAVDRNHARHLEERFQQAGIGTGYIDMLTPRHERESIRQQLHNGDIQVVVNVACLTMGVDWDVRCISLVRPTRSEMLFVQIIGRGLRTAPNKDHCLILDHSDTHLRMGFVTDIHHEQLHDGSTPSTAERAIALPKECPACHALKPPRTAVCPHCGHRVEAHQVALEEAPGELHEFTGKVTRAKQSSFDRLKPEHAWGMLLFIATEKQYKIGWCVNQFKELYQGTMPWDVWPRKWKMMPTMLPTPAMKSWVKSRMIHWARSKHNPAREEVVRDKGNNGVHNLNGMKETPVDTGERRQAFIPDTLMTEQDVEDFR